MPINLSHGKYFPVRDAAEMLGLSVGRIRQLIAEERISAVKLTDRMSLIAESEVKRFSKLKRKPGRPAKKKS